MARPFCMHAVVCFQRRRWILLLKLELLDILSINDLELLTSIATARVSVREDWRAAQQLFQG